MKNNIKLERARHNMTQADLAEKAQVSRQTINAMEAGRYVPSTLLSLKMAEIFKVEISELFQLEKKDWK